MSKKRIEGMDFIKKYDNNKKNYLPMVDYYKMETERNNEFGDTNIGWYAALLEDNRPFYAECWSTEGITMLTVYVSNVGIEKIGKKALVNKFIKNGYITPKIDNFEPDISEFEDESKNSFYAINITVGLPEEPARIEGGYVFPFSIKNEYIKEDK